jgi:cephalosporin-C deacetylase-like acetyl esterase
MQKGEQLSQAIADFLDHTTTERSAGQRTEGTMHMPTRKEVRFKDDGGDELSAWLYLPEVCESPRPAISMAHGFAATRWHGLGRFAELFAAAGFVVLLHDHRTFGLSTGEPRQTAGRIHWNCTVRTVRQLAQPAPDGVGSSVAENHFEGSIGPSSA